MRIKKFSVIFLAAVMAVGLMGSGSAAENIDEVPALCEQNVKTVVSTADVNDNLSLFAETTNGAAVEVVAPDTSWYDADATEYVIETRAQYLGLANITQGKAEGIAQDGFAGKTVKLNCDIDFSDMKFFEKQADGTVNCDRSIAKFSGTFDGQNHTVSALSAINDSNSGVSIGLIKNLYGTVKNLNVDTISIQSKGRISFGGAVIWANTGSTLENCNVKNANVTVTATNGVNSVIGGLAGMVLDKCVVTNCNVTNFTCTTANNVYELGGLIGRFYISHDSEAGSLENCTVSGFTAHVAGLCGHNSANSDGGNAGEGAAGNFGGIGGLIGYGHDGQHNYAFPIKNCHVKQLDITVEKGYDHSFVGGFAGMARRRYAAEDCSAQGKIKVGTGANVTRCYAGGFVGAPNGADLRTYSDTAVSYKNCTANVDVTATGTCVAGGFVGISGSSFGSINYSEGINVSYRNCTASGKVTSETVAGGFAGIADRGAFENCSAKEATVEADEAGGFIGKVQHINAGSDFIINLKFVTGASGLNLVGTQNEAVEVAVTEAVAEVDGTPYETLKKAISKAKNRQTVKVLADIHIGLEDMGTPSYYYGLNYYTYCQIARTVPAELTIDLNGHTVDLKEDAVEYNKEGKAVYRLFLLAYGSKVTVCGNGTINLNATTKDDKVSGYIFSTTNQGGAVTLNIENGTYYGNPCVVKNFGNNTITITGGTFGLSDYAKQYAEQENQYVWKTILNSSSTGNHSVQLKGGTMIGNDPRDTDDGNIVAEGYTVSRIGDKYTVIPTEKAVAKITNAAGVDYFYASLADAVAGAADGETVLLLKNANGDGMVIDKDITIDLGGHTYTVDGKLVSSEKDKGQFGFQLLKGSDNAVHNITIKNGTIQASKQAVAGTGFTSETFKEYRNGVYILMQNYADLTLENMTLVGNGKGETGVFATNYVLSANNGETVIKDSVLTAADGQYAFDVWGNGAEVYNGATVTVENSTINGFVNLGGVKEHTLKSANYVYTEDGDYIQEGEKFIKVYTLRFEAGEGSETESVKEKINQIVDLSQYKPLKAGYQFVGWYADEGLDNSIAEIKMDGNKTVYAKWEKIMVGGGTSRYTVTFNANGGSTVTSQTAQKNHTITEPTTPTKEGYIFDGWYSDKNCTAAYDFETKVTKNITLYAKWVEGEIGEPSNDNTDEWKNPFTDVKENEWYFDAVRYANENDLMDGTTVTTFAPNESITRAMLVTVLWRAEGEPAVDFAMPFADVTDAAYYAEALHWAVSENIAKGVTETEFAPDDNITREQIAAILYRYANYKGYDVSVGEDTNILSYTDYNEISEYAIEAIRYAVGSGLMKGKTESTFDPKDFAARAEIATILSRFIEGNK